MFFWLKGHKIAHHVRAIQRAESPWLWAVCGVHDVKVAAVRGDELPPGGRLCRLCEKAEERAARRLIEG